MELQHFSHQHPLVFIEEHSPKSEKVNCSGCGKPVSGPSFGCVQCKFYLDKQCAEAPSEMSHPFHRDHSFMLLTMKPDKHGGRCLCSFCSKTCENFVYHCSCGLDLHIKCALFSHGIAEKRIAKLQDISRIHPSIDTQELKGAKCFACWKPLLDSVFLSPDCGFYLHKKCVDLPPQINHHHLHQEHPLLLQFNSQRLSCNICQKTQRPGFVYCCSPCKFVIHTECATKVVRRHIFHKHPLVFNEEHSHKSEKVNCSGCGEPISGPSFGCVECRFYLDKQCAEAPSEMRHPFHHDHSFQLLRRPPYWDECLCNFCRKKCENFVYHCSCELDFHIKCALFSHGIAEKRSAELQDISRIDPPIDTGNYTEELKGAKCFVCVKPLLGSVYLSTDCGFYLHKKCVDLPPQINHHLHQEHPLHLQFNSQKLPCNICQETERFGFVYHCSPCNLTLDIECAENTRTIPTKINKPYHRKHQLFLQIVKHSLPCQICQETTNLNDIVYFCSICKFVVHVRCVSSPPTIEDKLNHEHPFSLLQRQVCSSCDACGTSGKYVPYVCSTCNLVVHKKCISLPSSIEFSWHLHNLSLKYFLQQDDQSVTWECGYCCNEVDTEHGSYVCSTLKCNYILHVNCATKYPGLYREIEEDEIRVSNEPTDAREIVAATWNKHSHHQHNLTLSEDNVEFNQCNGCLLPVSTPCYNCQEPGCDFVLHKSCAELPPKKKFWFHNHQKPLILTLQGIFRCDVCGYQTSGLFYACDQCRGRVCLRCALVPDITRFKGHDHLLYWRSGSIGKCNACGGSTRSAYRCERCVFVLHHNCIILPVAARHSLDEHPLRLTYHDDDNYSECHSCDICEKERSPEHWFYRCSDCNTSAHTKCVLGDYSFIKPGTIYENGGRHPHPLTFVRKDHIYPECHRCGEYCIDLSLECNTTGCSYIVHWDCVIPFGLRRPARRWRYYSEKTAATGVSGLALSPSVSIGSVSILKSKKRPNRFHHF